MYFCLLFRTNRYNMVKKSLLFIFTAIVIIACGGGGDEGGGSSTDDFDRGAMLVHLADDIIIPAFEDLEGDLTDLVSATEVFTETPNEANLIALKTSWLAAYKTWQYVEMFNIGAAEELNYSFFVNIYPVSVTEVENNITNGSYDLTAAANYDAQGFPAIDYLLYGLAEDSSGVLEKYTTYDNAAAYKLYLTDVVGRIKDLTTTILDDWNSSYRDEFVASTANTATSSFNKLINDFVFYYEKGLRANKVGIPTGEFSINPIPETVEAFYNQEVSKELALEAFTAVKDFFNGKNYNGTTSTLGFKAYLEYLDNDELLSSITSQFAIAEASLNDLEDNFVTQIAADNTKMELAYEELQKLVVLFKVDMLQAFNVSVDYIDGDND